MWAMKKKFLTLYDYGTGGIWTYILANSAKDILDKYPKLTIVDQEPGWFIDGRVHLVIRTIDIDDTLDECLK